MTRRITAIQTPIAHLVEPGKLKVVNAQLTFVARDASPVRLDPRTLSTVFCYGPVGITDDVFQTLFAHGIEVAWLTAAGSRCKGRLVRADPPTTSVRLCQHRAFATPAGRLPWARTLVAGKLDAQIRAARHAQRHGCGNAGAVLHTLTELRGRCRIQKTSQHPGD